VDDFGQLLKDIETLALAEISECSTDDQLNNASSKFLGKKSDLS
jgi:hypothetical protein